MPNFEFELYQTEPGSGKLQNKLFIFDVIKKDLKKLWLL